jgi:hypothetical protein
MSNSLDKPGSREVGKLASPVSTEIVLGRPTNLKEYAAFMDDAKKILELISPSSSIPGSKFASMSREEKQVQCEKIFERILDVTVEMMRKFPTSKGMSDVFEVIQKEEDTAYSIFWRKYTFFPSFPSGSYKDRLLSLVMQRLANQIGPIG